MLEAAYRHLSDTLAAAGAQALAEADDNPRAKLRAFIGVGFRPPFLGTQQLTARVVLWSQAATEPALHAVHAELYRRYRAKLASLIEPLAPGRTVGHNLVFAVSALLDGLWLERSAGESTYDVDAMLETAMRLIEAWILTEGAIGGADLT
jgi:TetR/AcrR family transcriptional regulator, transcriptional repressor of bet genes